MEAENKLSVIIPVYNTNPGRFERCLKSIIEGINANKEIIVVDDGSDQEKSKVYKDICERYNAGYFYQENQGVSKARNRGIFLAEGDFLMFVDADDRIIKADYAGWILWMAENQVDVLNGCICKKYTNGTLKEKKIHQDGLLFFYTNDDLIQLILTRNNREHSELKDVEIAGPYCKIIRKRLVDQMEFPLDIKIGEDMVFNLELLKKNVNYVIVNELWYEYHIDTGSAMDKFYPELEEQYFAAIDRIARMELTTREEEYLACRALYHYIKIIRIYITNKKRKECIQIIKKMGREERWGQYWRKIKLEECNLEVKYKIALILIRNRKSYLLYQMIKTSIVKNQKRLGSEEK